MRKAITVWVALAAGCLGQQTPTFRAGTTLVEFTTAAVDAKGAPVKYLKAREVAVGIAERAADGSFGFKARPASCQRPDNGAGVLYTRQWAMAAGTATVRVIVRDKRTGRQGSLDMALGE